MNWSDISFHPSSKTLRQFAGLWLVFFGGLACFQYLVRGNVPGAIALAVLAVTVGIAGLAWPGAVRFVYVGWMVLAFPIGWTVSRLLLAALYFGVVTPIGVMLRLIGRDPLQLRRRAEVESYWTEKPAPADVRRYFRQF